MASIAWAHLALRVETLSSASSLFNCHSSSGAKLMSCPKSIWFGDSPIVSFFLLLWTADVRANQCVQSSGKVDIIRHRYCLIHWFLRSNIPFICKWKAIDRFCLTSSFCVIALPKCNVKQGSQSNITFCGSPNYLYTWSMYSWAIPGSIIVVAHGRKTAALEHSWFTIVRIMSFPLCFGRPVMRSIATCWKGSVFSSMVMW